MAKKNSDVNYVRPLDRLWSVDDLQVDYMQKLFGKYITMGLNQF